MWPPPIAGVSQISLLSAHLLGRWWPDCLQMLIVTDRHLGNGEVLDSSDVTSGTYEG